MTQTGIIFDVQRGALHDGPGIRTAIFLKGCPLRCAWCHNPESWSAKPQLLYDEQRCVNCGHCAAACPSGAHDFAAGGHTLNREKCVACGRCVPVCAPGALRLSGRPVAIETLLSEAEKDRKYFTASGGGITLTGGEPMAQFAFTTALLAAFKAAGFHTCLETSGYAPGEHFAALQGLVDLYLFDYKATGEETHRRLTGVSAAPVLLNLDRLYARGEPVLLRCPLVPGVNDSDAHLQAIADLERRYPNLAGIELMPYHALGMTKARQAGIAMTAPGESASENINRTWRRKLAAAGARRVR